MLMTVLSYIGVFMLGTIVGFVTLAMVSANYRDLRSDEEQLEYIRKYNKKKETKRNDSRDI